MLFRSICAANRERNEQGHGSINFVWIESHLSDDEAIAQGYPKLRCIVNRYADELASRAADSFALSGDQTGLALSIFVGKSSLPLS